MTPDRVITQNCWVNAPHDVAQAVLGRVLALLPGIVGLQEWPSGRNDLLRASGRFVRLAAGRAAVRRVLRRRWRSREGYVWCRPLLGPTGPVGLKRDRYELLSCRAVTLTKRRKVTPVGNHKRHVLPANRITVVKARDHVLDELVGVIGAHLTSGVQRDGHYSLRPVDRERVANHKAQVVGLEDHAIADLFDQGCDVVYVLMDSNFDGLQLDGVTSAWAGREHQDRGTHENEHRKIDDAFGPGRADRVDLIEHPEKQIDHCGVLAVRHRTKEQPR